MVYIRTSGSSGFSTLAKGAVGSYWEILLVDCFLEKFENPCAKVSYNRKMCRLKSKLLCTGSVLGYGMCLFFLFSNFPFYLLETLVPVLLLDYHVACTP